MLHTLYRSSTKAKATLRRKRASTSNDAGSLPSASPTDLDSPAAKKRATANFDQAEEQQPKDITSVAASAPQVLLQNQSAMQANRASLIQSVPVGHLPFGGALSNPMAMAMATQPTGNAEMLDPRRNFPQLPNFFQYFGGSPMPSTPSANTGTPIAGMFNQQLQQQSMMAGFRNFQGRPQDVPTAAETVPFDLFRRGSLNPGSRRGSLGLMPFNEMLEEDRQPAAELGPATIQEMYHGQLLDSAQTFDSTTNPGPKEHQKEQNK